MIVLLISVWQALGDQCIPIERDPSNALSDVCHFGSRCYLETRMLTDFVSPPPLPLSGYPWYPRGEGLHVASSGEVFFKHPKTGGSSQSEVLPQMISNMSWFTVLPMLLTVNSCGEACSYPLRAT